MRTPPQNDTELLTAVVRLAREAGARLQPLFDLAARPVDRAAIFAALKRNDQASLQGLQEGLKALRPEAQWVDDDAGAAQRLEAGEWWAIDPVEGNVNHIYGLPEWSINVALLRDGAPVLTVVYQPVGDRLFTAVRGGGAWLNGARLKVSSKVAFDAAIVTTGQAELGQEETYDRLGSSVTAMLQKGTVVRMAVPSTFPIALLASGQNDVFWQYSPVTTGIVFGVLLAQEAGAVVSRVNGAPWALGAPDILICTPGLHGEAVAVLRDL